MNQQDIYLVGQFGIVHVPIIKVVRSGNLDHFVMDRREGGRCKISYHGNGQQHLRDEAAPLTAMDEARVNAARQLGWRYPERHAGYRGGREQRTPVAQLTYPELVCGFSYSPPYDFLDERQYTRKSPPNVVEMVFDLQASSIEVDVYLCPLASLPVLRARYAVCEPYLKVEPAIVFCREVVDTRPTIRKIYPPGWTGERD